MIHDFLHFLEHSIEKGTLPGTTAQQKMSPQFLSGQIPSRGHANSSTRISSVLVALCPDQHHNITVLLTLRSKHLNHHSRQISFPGGKVDSGETVEQTALRETYEEVNIIPDKISITGELTGLYVRKSDNYVHPIVGYCRTKPKLKINPLEVEQAFFVPLKKLTGEQYLEYRQQKISGLPMQVPYWNIHEKVPLWGATAMMLSELVTLYELFMEQ